LTKLLNGKLKTDHLKTLDSFIPYAIINNILTEEGEFNELLDM